MNKKITWLHLSDLHVGQSGQYLWPNFKDRFFDDLRLVVDLSGSVDLVLFTGDLTQTGAADEFERLTDQLEEIWLVLKECGCAPSLVCVPGNHDLVRPNPRDARVKQLHRWHDDPDVREDFWAGGDSQYRDVIQQAFENYERWKVSLSGRTISTLPTSNGIVPGDFSATFSVNDLSVGLVGLNSTFLQLDNSNCRERLVMDIRQINAVTSNEPGKWFDQHDFNFLLTHHPPNWLSPDALHHFNSEISRPGRFDIHFFGHVHEAKVQTTIVGGGAGRRISQAASLFGIERIANENVRLHGYAVGSITQNGSKAELNIWPRRARSSDYALIANAEDFDLVPPYRQHMAETIATFSSAGSAGTIIQKPVDLAASVGEKSSIAATALKRIEYYLPKKEQHKSIRNVERKRCLASFNAAKPRPIWICADWGSGRDGFLWSVLSEAGRSSDRTFKIDLENYSRREEFLSSFLASNGCTLQAFCDAFASAGKCILILDDAPTTGGEAALSYVEHDVEDLVSLFNDFCPKATIIVSSRRKPKLRNIELITLLPLDEADTRTYLLAHPLADDDVKTTHGVSEIQRRSDGFPDRIDSSLKRLRVTTLADLEPPTANELVDRPLPDANVPRSLVDAVMSLRGQERGDLRRSWILLKTLAVLPSGESLDTMKRVESNTPLYSDHAEELLDLELIAVRKWSSLKAPSDPLKILVSPRPVRDYVISLLGPDESLSIVRKVVSLYFGDGWRSGGAAKLSTRLGISASDDRGITQNLHYLTMHLLASASTWESTGSASSVLNLCLAYGSELHKRDMFRACSTVCRDYLKLIPASGYESYRDKIGIFLAKSLRMLGDKVEAPKLFEELLSKPLSKSVRAGLHLSYALGLKADDGDKAVENAKMAIALNPKGNTAMHAQAIVLQIEGGDDSRGKLIKLEREARKKEHVTLVNNLVLDRIESIEEASEAVSDLREVYRSAFSEGDLYTAGRATVRLSKILMNKDGALSEEDTSHLIDAYHYFYNERFRRLFQRSHETLWRCFEKAGQTKNLLTLFRYSSFIWRLNGDEGYEIESAQRLVSAASHLLQVDFERADQDTAYFLTRASTLPQLGEMTLG